MTPKQAYDQLEKIPPQQVKNVLLDVLAWQDRHGKALVHVGFYLRCLFYTVEPRDKTPTAIQQLTAGIGREA